MRIPTPISIESAEHYVWGGRCDGWHLLKNAALSVIRERVPAGLGEVRHFHGQARQFFYVLNGVTTLEFGQTMVELKEGDGIEVPPGLAHRFVNRSTEEVHFLVISSPTTMGDRTNVDGTP